MKDTILAIAGKPGLFRLVSRGNGRIIIETIDSARKRMPASIRDRVTSLFEVAIYTDDDTVPILTVFESICQKETGAPVPFEPKTASEDQLTTYLAEVLPNYDRDTVRLSDMRKLFTWYNILVSNGFTDFAAQEEDSTENPEEAS